MAIFKAIWKFLLELLFPAFCLGCGNEGSFLCKDCFRKIKIKKIQTGGGSEFLDGIISACPYSENPLLQKCIHTFKYEFVRELAEPLGKILTDALKTNFDFGDKNCTKNASDASPDFGSNKITMNEIILCPVPLHPKRLRWRGFNQAELLASAAGSGLGLPVMNLLTRKKFLKPQMELSRQERLENVQGVFALADASTEDFIKIRTAASIENPIKITADASIKNKTIFLVDDVATTLSTLNDCAGLLKSKGFKKVFGIVLARVD
jgi:predicted amidophosphoribosyltransferase